MDTAQSTHGTAFPVLSGAGHVVEFVIGLTWLDESPSAGTYLFYNASTLGALGLAKITEGMLAAELDSERRRAATWDDDDHDE